MYSDSSSKNEILNKQFQSVFTKKSTTTTPRLFGNKYPSIGNLSITLKGVQKLLEKINISKAAGPDLIPGRMLNMLAPELAPIVHAIFTQSLDTGELPRDWSLANVAPIFKKGNRVLAENYRPVSLTCITCKLFEHIVCRHIHIGTLFFSATISSWNNLPFGIEKVDSVEGFKLKLKEHTFRSP